MSKIIARLIVGIIAAFVLKLISSLLLPVSLTESEAFDKFISLCYVACIVVPCAIYFLHSKPGTNNKGERVE